jgi:hopene-associated glycosyltransferase HpnB
VTGIWVAVGGSSLAIWLYLLVARGGFWLAAHRDGLVPDSDTENWPSVVAVVPARNEADVIQRSLETLLRQDYPGYLRVVLVDDDSDDGTSARAAEIVQAVKSRHRVDILHGRPLPQGWTGKLWALEQGIAFEVPREQPEFLLLTDADIGHSPDAVQSLVARAQREGFVLVSLMAELSCATWSERFLIPAFVFFFQMLYPFSWVARIERSTAAAAGGCMLIRRESLDRAGGISAIRSEIIDDCALARRLKKQGKIWLALTRRAKSLRPYGSFADIGRMVSRSAYAQLRYSPLFLAGAVSGMLLVYIVPPLLAAFASGTSHWAGLCSWILMAGAFQPILRFYRVSPLWGLALPAIGAAYTVFVLNSAYLVWRGRGGMWKGRAQAMKANA